MVQIPTDPETLLKKISVRYIPNELFGKENY
jgi:hypothetical protein